ncbi:MAG: TusE/DsrC/DsvC family sulfur relay protein [Candidatus Moranbacteria bacterium]|nr:TusE/DsrC/DsvC family sulfur relay protein [Candidatus Moranbacteria bacterium]
MPIIERNEKRFEVDDDGFLRVALEKRDPDWERCVMVSTGIDELTPELQRVLDEIWAHYKRTGLIPIIQVLAKNTGLSLVRISKLSLMSPKNWASKMLGLRAIDCKTSHG